MRLSLSEISTVGASFAEDVAAYAAAGFDGIGIWEFKLPADDEANRALLDARAGGDELRPDRAVVPAARDPRHGRAARPGRAARRNLRLDQAAGGVRPRVRSLSHRAAGRAHRGCGEDGSSWKVCKGSCGPARELGVPLAFEPIHHSQRDTRLVRELDTRCGGPARRGGAGRRRTAARSVPRLGRSSVLRLRRSRLVPHCRRPRRRLAR